MTMGVIQLLVGPYLCYGNQFITATTLTFLPRNPKDLQMPPGGQN